MDGNSLILNMIFSSIGFGYFIYGKKQDKIPVLIAGIGLILLTYIVTNLLAMLLIGIALMVAPFFIEI